MDRDAFLARVRAQLTAPAPANVAHPIPPFEGVPGIELALDLDDLPTAFERAAAAHGAVVRRVHTAADLGPVLDEVVSAHDVGRVALSADPEAAAVADAVRGRDDVEVVSVDDPRDLASVDLGITGVSWAIAATGTLVVEAGRAGARSVSLVPPVHLALVPTARIVATTSDVWRSVPQRFPEGLPSQLVFISGPSKSADIEFTLTVGVHGPKHVWMCLVDEL